MDVDAFITDLTSREGWYEDQIVAHRRLKPRIARTACLERPLAPAVDRAVRDAGIEELYLHQAEAIDALRRGEHTIVATGTASGKTLCYHVPVLEACEAGGTALYLSPTKALAQDQLRQVTTLGAGWVTASTYDGDTPSEQRSSIRRHANLVLTNPDMLHTGILPHHELWRPFLRRLRFVVVDEAHVLRGVFGSHVSLVLRRLRRIATRYGAEPTFAFASATIGNPDDHAAALSGLRVKAVTADGSPAGERHVVFWNPPLLDDDSGGRRSTLNETSVLVSELIGHDARTLAFSKSRMAAELVARYARDRTTDHDRIRAYRAGYLARERREIETGLQDGTLAAVSATNALELGIDVGGLDAVVLNGFPGTVASAWQQAGRAGREGQPSLAVVVPADQPLDQYYATHPDRFFAKPHEAALVNPANPHLLRPHLGCAAYEMPLTTGDTSVFGPDTEALASELVADGALRERRDRLYWARRRPPAPDVDIRSIGGSPYRIVEASTGRLIGTVDAARAFGTVHPGAIYVHQDETYVVEDLRIDERVALVRAESTREYTQARSDSDLVILDTEREDTLGRVGLRYGLVEVTEHVVGYQRKRPPSGDVVERVDLDLPPQTLVTRAVWYTIPETMLMRAIRPLEGDDVLLGALHAAEHAGIGILPVFAMCDRWDIGGLSTNLHPDTGEPTIFIYDGYPQGAGISEHAFEVAREHLSATADHVSACPCRDGCPSCVQSPKCGNGNEPLHKAGAVVVLDLITGASPATRPRPAASGARRSP